MLEKQNFIPEPEEFIGETPMTATLKEIKKLRDEEVRQVIAGKSEKMLIVVGPCSAHEPAPTLEYISRLGKLNEKVLLRDSRLVFSDSCIYCNHSY